MPLFASLDLASITLLWYPVEDEFTRMPTWLHVEDGESSRHVRGGCVCVCARYGRCSTWWPSLTLSPCLIRGLISSFLPASCAGRMCRLKTLIMSCNWIFSRKLQPACWCLKTFTLISVLQYLLKEVNKLPRVCAKWAGVNACVSRFFSSLTPGPGGGGYRTKVCRESGQI